MSLADSGELFHNSGHENEIEVGDLEDRFLTLFISLPDMLLILLPNSATYRDIITLYNDKPVNIFFYQCSLSQFLILACRFKL